ncbi:hypothetical protein ACH5RR_000539 [Cinchona calisaya]|uniref:Uncharacterized protein n=1 Tax=Cinchona calisaya TaxID=153742 RepID=A0ABD3B112_9GENT
MEKFMKSVNQECFTKSRVNKMEEKLSKVKMCEKEITHFIYMCLGGEAITNFGIVDLNHMDSMIDQNMEKANRRLLLLKVQIPKTPAINVPFEKSLDVYNQGSMMAPEITITEINKQGSLMASEMSMNDKKQSLTWDMDMSKVNEQTELDEFDWDDYPNNNNDNGARPSSSNH